MRLLFILMLLISTSSFAKQQYSWEWFDNKSFAKEYKKALTASNKNVDEWLETLSGVSSLSKKIKIGKEDFNTIWCCKAHDCGDNYIYILYNSESKALYGHIVTREANFYIGQPTDELKNQLKNLM